jgi:acetyl coenzyme A synthetase (ADP forming)-like protein
MSLTKREAHEVASEVRAVAQAEPVRADLGLEAIFRPRSIAVIGASRERGTVGAEIFHNLIEHGFHGPVYPVNPKASVVQSVAAYPNVTAIPGDVDLAVIVVPARHALEVLEECGKKGVRGAVVISAGFREVGEDGAARQRALVECAKSYGIRLVGPNCLGVMNTAPDVRLDATFSPTYPPAGRLAFSSQSGALGLAILEYANDLGLGISQFISIGNKADVSGNDLLLHWEQDPATDVILLYLESFGNPRRFTQIARRVGRTKPIVAVKSGRTAAGARAAASHTGSLAGADAAVTALCLQSGVIRTDTIEELFDVAMVLAHQPVPRGARVAIVTNAGGPGIMASDACETHGLEVPSLEPDTVARLREFLAPEASTRNPVDMIASATPEAFERTVRLTLNDPNVDAVIVIYVPPMVTTPLAVAQAIVRGAEAAAADAALAGMPAKPTVSCFMGSHGVPEGLRSLREGRIPSYRFPESAVIAMSRAARYGRWLAEPEGELMRFADCHPARAEAVIERARSRAQDGGHVWLHDDEVREVLAAYGIATVESMHATTPEAAAEAARRLGFPVVVKLLSDRITHKSEVGGVALDLRTEDEVRAAFAGIQQRLAARGESDAMQGVLVQSMVKDGAEAIVGVANDPSFGPLIMFGLGGVFVELLQDVTFRVHPLTDRDAHQMVREVRGYKLLQGFRGSAPGDIAALEQLLLRVSQMLGNHTIAELDLNPIKVRQPGHGCVVVDARIAV